MLRITLLALSFTLVSGLGAGPNSVLPAQSGPRTTALFGAAVAGGQNPETREDPAAFTGRLVVPTRDYQVLASAPLPPEGDTFHIWLRYRALALQMKTQVGGKTVEFPWSWTRHPDAFAWRKVGVFERAQLGAGVFFIADNKRTSASGLDALVVTADAAWLPPGVSAPAAKPRPPAPPPAAAADLNAPDAANATVTLAAAAPAESDQPGSAEVSIDWGKTAGRVPPFLYSLNNFRGTSAERMASPAWHRGIDYLAPRLLRLHNAGLIKTWYDPAAGTWAYEKIRAALEAARRPGDVALMININSWPESYDADQDGRLDPERLADYARLCADLVRFVNLEVGAGVHYWEITNEKDFAYWRKPREGRLPDVAALAAVYNAAAAAIRRVDPTVKLGGPAACNPLPVEPLIEFARLTRDQLDFLSFHNYASGSADESDQTIYEKTAVMAQDTADVVRRLKKAVPDREIEVHLNEHNICYSWRVPEPRMTNHKGAVFDALSLIAYARIPGLTATNAWNDQDRVYGKLDPEGNPRPGAHVYHYFNTLLLGTRAAATSSAEKAVVPFAVADGHAGRPAFVLVNRTNAPQTVTLHLTPAEPAGAWFTASIDAGGLHPEAPAALADPLTLPPHGVHFFWQN